MVDENTTVHYKLTINVLLLAYITKANSTSTPRATSIGFNSSFYGEITFTMSRKSSPSSDPLLPNVFARPVK